eukprot:gene11410-9917_t
MGMAATDSTVDCHLNKTEIDGDATPGTASGVVSPSPGRTPPETDLCEYDCN